MSKNQTSYKLLNISLLESLFKRENNIELSNPKFKEDISISTANKRENNKIFIKLGLCLSADIIDNKKKIPQYEIKVEFLGVFEFDEEDKLSVDTKYFADINGPAIIFPFIREHVSYLSIRSGIKHILLPPINFVKLIKKIGTI